MHKEEGGTVTIAVEMQDVASVGTVTASAVESQYISSLLRVIITDDGVGRAASAELKSKSASWKQQLRSNLTDIMH